MIRRIVAAHQNGKSVVLNDGSPAVTHVFEKIPGMEFALAWATPTRPEIAAVGEAEVVSAATSLIPRQGETRLIFLKVPPDAIVMRPDFDPAAAAQEFAEHQGEIAATLERDHPGMHRTDSIDYIIVLEGEIHLELDDQKEVLLRQHDVLILNGTRHAWRNKSEQVASLAVILVGAMRQ